MAITRDHNKKRLQFGNDLQKWMKIDAIWRNCVRKLKLTSRPVIRSTRNKLLLPKLMIIHHLCAAYCSSASTPSIFQSIITFFWCTIDFEIN